MLRYYFYTYSDPRHTKYLILQEPDIKSKMTHCFHIYQYLYQSIYSSINLCICIQIPVNAIKECVRCEISNKIHFSLKYFAHFTVTSSV